MQLNHVRLGSGKRLLLVPGLGASWHLPSCVDQAGQALQPVLPLLTGNPVTRTVLLAQFSARPWALSPQFTLRELRGYATAPSFDAALDALIDGPLQQGAPSGSTPGPLVIGWGRNDRVTFPSQAESATRLFPDARLHWFDHCGHFPHWDVPAATVRLILDSTA